MLLYSQNNPKWKNIKIGKTNLSIGGFGCFLDCYAMIDGRPPDVINEIFTRDGVYSDGLAKHTPTLTDDTLIDSKKACRSLNLIYDGYVDEDPHKLCVAEVRSGYKFPPRHFVVWLGNGRIADPKVGALKDNGYGEPLTYRLIRKA